MVSPERLSGFLIQLCLFEAIGATRFGASAIAVDERVRDEVLARVDPLPLAPWRWLGTRFHARAGALVMTSQNDGAHDVHLAARSPFLLSPFEDLVGEQWDCVAF